MKKYIKPIIITSLIIIIPIIAGLILWNRLPEQIPTHFNTSGEANDYSSKTFAVIAIPLFLLAMHFMCFFSALSDPKKAGHNKAMLWIVLGICPCVSLLCGFMMYSAALGYTFNIGLIMSMFVGILFAIIGFFLPKCKRNYTIGIKLPWTMDSDENWDKTHKIAGFIWVIGGLIILSTAFLANFWILMGIIFVMVIVPTIYSYSYYLKNEKNM